MSAAREMAEKLEQENALFDAALVYAGLGDTDQAFDLLQRNEDWGHWPAIALNNFYSEPLRTVRADERYADVMRRVANFWHASDE